MFAVTLDAIYSESLLDPDEPFKVWVSVGRRWRDPSGGFSVSVVGPREEVLRYVEAAWGDEGRLDAARLGTTIGNGEVDLLGAFLPDNKNDSGSRRP